MASQGHSIPVSHPTVDGSMKVTFEARPFGIQYEGNMITDVIRQSQAEVAGVCVGWSIMSVNGETNIPDSRTIARLIASSKQANKPTIICFGQQVVINYKNGVRIRKNPEYPGEGTIALRKGEIVAYCDQTTVEYQDHSIKFYELTDDRGWVHNYNPDVPEALNGVLEIAHVKVMYASGIQIRKQPIYPGKRTGHTPLPKGLIIGYTHRTMFDYNGISITFYKLADSRGWIHNFNPDSPTSLDTVQELGVVKRMEKQGQLTVKPPNSLVAGLAASLFELHGDTLYYFQGEKDREPDAIVLDGANITVGGGSSELTFTIETKDKKTYLLKAKDENDKNEWLGALAAAMGKEREQKTGGSLESRLKRLKAENVELQTLVEELQGHISAVANASAVTTTTTTTTTTDGHPYVSNPSQRAVWI